MSELLKIQVLDGGLLDVLQPLIERLENPAQLYQRLGEVHARNVDERFGTKTDPDGDTWDDLAPSTQKSYAKKYGGNIPGSLLQRHVPGMYSSLTHESDSEGATVGFNQKYAIFHETGTRKMKRRGTLVSDWQTGELGASDRADLVAEIESFLTDRF